MIILLTTGCSNKEVIYHNYTFRGESENWIGEFKVSATQIFTEIDKKTHYDSKSEKIFTLTYKGKIKDLLEVEDLQYSYGSLHGGGGGNLGKPDKKEIIHRSSSGSAWIVSKEEVIKVTVEVDGKVEKFELINTDN